MRVRKYLYLLLFQFLAFLLVTTAAAQSFNAGITAGICATQVDGDYLNGYNKAGIKAGGFVNRKLSSKMSLQFEMEFIQKGSRQPLNQDENTYYLLRLHYVEAPLLLSYFVTKKWNIEAGLSVAVLLSNYEEDNTGIPFHSVFHKYDYLYNIGANYVLSQHFIANARYNYSLVPIRKVGEEPGYLYFQRNEYNNVVEFSLMFQF